MVRVVLLAMCLTVFPGRAAQAASEGTLGEAVDAIAQDAAKFLAGQNEVSVTVGNFAGIGEVANLSSSGPTIARELTLRLANRKIAVQPRSRHTLVGEFGEVEDKVTARQAVEIKWKIVVTKDRSVAFESQTPQFVLHERAVTNLLGLTVEQNPADNKEDRNKKMKDAIDRPKPALADAKVRAAAGSPFSVEVLTAPANGPKAGKRKEADYALQTPKLDAGFAYVPIARDEVYAVRLTNDADFDAAVDLRVDGLSMYTFSEAKFRDRAGQPIYRYVIVPKKASVLIRGWHVSNDDSDEFLVTSYAKSAVGMTASSANVGTITANFHAAWPKNGKPPADEPRNPGPFSQSADATGRGKRFDQKFVEVESEVGVLRSAISVRYVK